MQSGIKASSELKSAFKAFQNSSDLALLVTIANESLEPSVVVSSPSSSFPDSLNALQQHLNPTTAAYIVLRTPSGLNLATYVPDSAPVRSKMLFASTRLTLVRELGTEHFQDSSLFVTTAQELTPAGWRAHEAHLKLEQPLTEEERASKELKEAETREASGTGRREGHYVGGQHEDVTSGHGPKMNVGEGVLDALEGLKGGGDGHVVQLHLEVAEEKILLAGTQHGIAQGDLAQHIPSSSPQYTFYTFTPDGDSATRTVFIYTCPPTSKVKDRMVYASTRRVVANMAEQQVGLTLDKRLEGAGPEDFTKEVLENEFVVKKEESKGFARPKRPGRR